MTKASVTRLSWHNCYRQGWGREIQPEAYNHPAKAARGLARRIYEHTIERGYLKPGDTCLDPFAGIGGFALDALANGLHFVGVELEQNFVDMGAGCDCTGISKADWVACFGRWKRFAHTDGRRWCPRCLAEAGGVIEPRPPTLPGMEPEPTASYERNSGKIPHTEPHRYAGNLDLFARHARGGATAVLVQGDSRRLCEVLEGARAEGLISSPPYAYSMSSGQSGIDWTKTFDSHRRNRAEEPFFDKMAGGEAEMRYSTDPAQLGNMPTGEPPSAIVSSPPFSPDQPCASQTQALKDYHAFTRGDGTKRDHVMRSEGNLGNMPTGEPPQAVIASPPFVDPRGVTGRSHDGLIEGGYSGGKTALNKQMMTKTDGQLAAMREGDVDAVIASPPWQKSLDQGTVPKEARVKRARDVGLSAAEVSPIDMENIGLRTQPDYGTSDGQLAALPEGEPPQVDGLVASPPFSSTVGLDGGASKRQDDYGHIGSWGKDYGTDPDNLGNMKEGEPAAGIVSSPPWEATEGSHSAAKFHDPEGSAERRAQAYQTGKIGGHFASKEAILRAMQKANQSTYGDDPDNLGNQQGDTFWSAAKTILDQCRAVLAPGGVAIWVLKAFVRNKKIVDFPGQWEMLCNSCGFETVEVIRAWLVEDRGAQFALNGDLVERKVARKSFFRRLHERKYPHLAINYEIVLVTRKRKET